MKTYSRTLKTPRFFFTTHNTNTITLNYAPAPDGIKTAALVADTSTSVGTFMQRNLTVPNDSSQYTWTFYVKKDDDTARFPVFWFNFFGNSLIYNYMNFDTKTGAIHNFTPTRLTARSVSEEDYWRVSMTIQNDSSGNNGISLRVDPAKVSALSNSVWTSSDVTMTGSLVFAHSQLMRNAPAVLPIDDSGSTLSGNMTGGGGLSAIFDGDKTKNNSQAASGANTNSNDSFVIVDHGSPKTVAAFTAYASTDAQGFDGDSGSSIITFTLAGSTDNFSSSNVALFSDTTGDGAGKVHAINSTSTSGSQRITLGAYRYHKMTVQTNTVNSGEKFGRLAQLEFFESTTPATYIPTYGSAASLPFTDTLDLIDTAPTENYIRNNTMEGASAGTPGTAPTGWAIIGNGATVQLVGYGVTDDGIEYVDYKFSGTPTFGDPWMYFQDGASIPALAGEEWTYSAYVALIAGSLTNLVSTQEIALQTIGRNSAGSYVSFAGQQQFTPASDLVRHAFTATLSGATVTRVSNKIIINWDGSGAIDATFRIGNPQMEKRSHASQVIKTGAHTMRQNLLTYSEQLDQWTASGTIAVANAMVAPDGSQTMDTLRVTTGSSNIWEHRQSIHGVVETSSVYTVSGYFKHDGTNRSIISFINPTSPYNNMAELGFAWSGGTPTQNSFSGTGTPVFTDVGNDIWRISFQVTTHATATDFRVNVFPNGGYLGTDVVGVWGMQVEIGSTANTYIPTTTAAVFEPTKRTSLNSFVEIQKKEKK